MTLEEFLEQPEEEPALEYEDGVVKQKVSPKGPHGRLQFWLGRLCDTSDGPTPRTATFTETRVTLGGNSLVPDLIVYRWDRIPLDAEGWIAENFTTPPDIAVEVLSPGQSVSDHEQRCQRYVEHGVQVALFAHPRRKVVKLFRPGAEPKLMVGDDAIDLAPVLSDVRFTVDELFGTLRPRG